MSISPQHAVNFLRYVFGETPVGSAENEAIERAHSPELRAFLQGVLGKIPESWWGYPTHEKETRHAFSDFLREVADMIDSEAR